MNESAIAWAWRQPAVATDKLVLLALATVVNNHGEATPTLATLATMCGITRRSVQRTLRKLFAVGLIECELRQRDNRATMSNRYRLAIPHIEMSAAPNEAGAPTARPRVDEQSDIDVTRERHPRRSPADTLVARLTVANPDEIRHEKRRPLFPELAKVVG
ncbi:MAG: helix-turn-helix domain-containing protein [Gammaproteobacteria bacterium]|nr:helix-turn-helix domain-containing protein [Gammaproteobacteria bacterium]